MYKELSYEEYIKIINSLIIPLYNLRSQGKFIESAELQMFSVLGTIYQEDTVFEWIRELKYSIEVKINCKK